jgi:cephalosporin-C deacetylase
MALVDMTIEELKVYNPEKNKEKDFDQFWNEKLQDLRSSSIKYNMEKIDSIVPDVDVYKVFYEGYMDSEICGHYLTPRNRSNVPAILSFHGYTGNKGPISLDIKWPLMGYAVFSMDVRGQSGESFDNRSYRGPSLPGFMTKGIFDKNDYYYLGVYLDCVRAIDFLADREEIDIKRLCVAGISQGGGLSLATAALDDRPKLCISEMPYLCHFKRAVEWAEPADKGTYLEIASLIRRGYPDREDDIYKTLSYFDNLNLCGNIKARTIMTCALKDIICPPSTVFAVYNNIKSDKHIELMAHSEHDYFSMLWFEAQKMPYIINNL